MYKEDVYKVFISSPSGLQENRQIIKIYIENHVKIEGELNDYSFINTGIETIETEMLIWE